VPGRVILPLCPNRKTTGPRMKKVGPSWLTLFLPSTKDTSTRHFCSVILFSRTLPFRLWERWNWNSKKNFAFGFLTLRWWITEVRKQSMWKYYAKSDHILHTFHPHTFKRLQKYELYISYIHYDYQTTDRKSFIVRCNE
jgi:hypothetical protein